MKMPKMNSSMLLGVGIAALGLVQSALTNKKETSERQAMKEELFKELTKELSSNKES